MDTQERPVRSARLFPSLVVLAVLSGALIFGSSLLLGQDPFAHGMTWGLCLMLCAFFGVLLAASLFAFGSLKKKSPLWFGVPLLGFFAAYFFAFSQMHVLLWILFLCAGVLMYALVLRGTCRTVFVGVLCALVSVLLVASLALFLRAQNPQATVGELLEVFSARVTAFSESMLHSVSAQLGENEELKDALSAIPAGALSTSVMLSLPAALLGVCYGLSYLISVVYRLLLKRTLLAMLYPKDGFLPRPTLVTAVVFGICLLATSLFSGLLSPALYATFSAVQTMLELLFAAVGVCVFVARLRLRRSRGTLFAACAVALVVVLSLVRMGVQALGLLLSLVTMLVTGLLLPVLYIVGLFATVFSYVRERKNRSER